MDSTWFRFEKTAPDSVDIYIIDFIGDWLDDMWGFGVTARAFVDTLASLPDSVKNIRVLINSPGGDVYSGLTIANALRLQHAERGRSVETVVMGIAASSASLIMMGGSIISMADNAVAMIHPPWTMTRGGAKAHLQAAARMDVLRDSAVQTYRWHSTESAKDIAQMMDDETYLTADEAVRMGFATRKIAGKFEKSRFPASVVADLKLPARMAEFAKELTQPARAFVITKADPVKKQCFGWASVAVTVDGEAIVDAHDHVIEPGDLEQAAYGFVMLHRDLDERHTAPVRGTVIESMVVTPDKLKAMGLPTNALPQGWWVGFQITDDAVFAKVQSGEYTMFSIAGTASLEDTK